MEDAKSKSTSDLIKRQGELVARMAKLGNEVSKCSNELDKITKELEQRVAEGEEEPIEEVSTESTEDSPSANEKKNEGSASKDGKRDLTYYTSTKTANTALRQAAKKERAQNIQKPRPAVREFKHW